MQNDELRKRLEALEARVEELEVLFGRRPAPTPVQRSWQPPRPAPAPPPTVVPPPLPESPPPPPERVAVAAAEAKAPAARDLERFFGLTVLGRVGIAALLLAGAYFGQLGWAKIGPGARTALLYAVGIVMIAAGFVLRPRVVAKYTVTLWGGGMAMTYLAGVLGHLVFHVVPSTTALISLFATTAAGQFLAQRAGIEAMATITLAGAYAAPVLVGTPSATPTAFFVLLLTLHAWAAWTEHRWRWTSARALAVLATILLVVGWYVKNGMGGVASSTLHTTAVWLGLALPELLVALRRRDVAADRSVAIAAGFATVLMVAMIRCDRSTWNFAPCVLAVGGLVAGAALRTRCVSFGTWLARAASLFAAAAFVTWFDLGEGNGTPWLEPVGRLVGIAIVTAALLLTRRWTGTGESGAIVAIVVVHAVLWTARTRQVFVQEDGSVSSWPGFLAIATPLALLLLGRHTVGRVIGLLAAAFFARTWIGGNESLAGEHGGTAALSFAVASGTAALGAWLAAIRRDRWLAVTTAGLNVLVLLSWFVAAASAQSTALPEPTWPLWNPRSGALVAIIAMSLLARAKTPGSEGAARAVLAATALVATYSLGLTELLDAIEAWTFGPRAVATSIYTLAFASVLLTVGFRRRIPALRWTALATFGAVVVKIAAYDLRETDTPVRMLVTAVLGGVLLVAAWAYARRSRPPAA